MKRTTILLGALIAASVFTMSHGAYTIPTVGAQTVYDLAQVIQPARLSELNSIIQRIEKQTGVEIAVVILPSLGSNKVKLSQVEPYASDVFNQWGIGHKLTNNGVLMLVALKEGVVRYELGSDFSPEDMGPIVDKFDKGVRPLLEAKNFSDGVFAASMLATQTAIEDVSWWWYHRVALIFFGCAFVALGGVLWAKKHQLKEGVWFGMLVFVVLVLIGLWKFDPDRSKPGFGGGLTHGVGMTQRWSTTRR